MVQRRHRRRKEQIPHYAIDIKKFEAAGRSFHYAVYSRLCKREDCEFCKDIVQTEIPLNSLPDYKKMVEGIAKHCSKQADYLPPKTTMLEAVFRLLLANHNDYMTTKEISEHLTSLWTNEAYRRDLSEEMITRLIGSNNSYYIYPKK